MGVAGEGDGRGRGAHAALSQPRQGALSRGRVHQGRGHRLLRRRRRRAPAPPRRPAAHPQALARRHRQRSRSSRRTRHVALPTGCAPSSWRSTATTASSTSCATTCRPWSGSPTSRRWNCTSRSGRSTDAGGPQDADLLVFDLDPGAPADIIDCCNVALALRELLDHRRPDGVPEDVRQQGRAAVRPDRARRPRDDVGVREETGRPARPGPPRRRRRRRWTRRSARGKVFIDWSQNNGAKTTIAPYSLRGIDRPTVSTPLTWDEVARRHEGVRPAVRDRPTSSSRLEEHGDLLADMPDHAAPLP